MADKSYTFRLRGDAEQLASSVAAAASSVDKLADTTEAFARQQATSAAAGDRFVASLQRQIDAAGKTGSSLLALKAAELGVSDAATPLIAQIDALAAGQAREQAAAQRAADTQRLLTTVRTAAANAEREQYQAQQAFLAGLESEAAALGKSRAELLAMQAAQLGVTAQAQPLIDRVTQAERATSRMGGTSKLTAMELQQVGYQLNDFAVQVYSGGSAMTALVQQGSQLSGTFGGVGAAARALASLITPVVLGLTALAAAVVAVGLAYKQAYDEDEAFRKSIALTGNFAGQTADSMRTLSQSIASAADTTIGKARDIAQALVATGQIGPSAIGAVGEAVARTQKLTGESADKIVGDFASMSNGVAEWAATHSRVSHFLTDAQYAYIRSLEAQGRAEQAMTVAAGAYNDAMAKRTVQLGYLERAYQGLASAASSAWNSMLGVGRDETKGEELERLTAHLAAQREALEFDRTHGASENQIAGRLRGIAADEAAIARVRGEISATETKAKNDAQQALKTQQDLEHQSATYQSAQRAVRQVGIDAALQQAQEYHDRELKILDDSYAQQAINQRGYIQVAYSLDQQLLTAKAAAIQQEIELEKKKPVGNEAEALQQQAAIAQQQLKLAAVRNEQREAADRLARGQYAPAARSVVEDAQTTFRQSELQAQLAEGEAFYRQQHVAQLAAAAELVQTNKGLAIDLIRDDRQRGEAQIAAEAERLRRTLELDTLSETDRERVSNDLALYIANRQAQLNRELQPEYQRMLDDWADTHRLMKEAHDEFLTDFIKGGEDAWVEMFKTGKLNIGNLADIAISEAARVQYRQSIAPLVAKGGEAISGWLGFGGAASGGNSATAGAAATAQGTNTAAVATSTTALGLMNSASTAVTGALTALTSAATSAAAALQLAAGGGGSSALAKAGAGFDWGSIFGSSSGGSGTSAALDAAAGSYGDTGLLNAFGFAGGGFAAGRSLHRINEDGPEVFSQGGRDYLMTGARGGFITPSGSDRGAPQQIIQKVDVHNNHPTAQISTQQRSDGGLMVMVDAVEQRLGSRIDNGVGLGRNIRGRYGVSDVLAR